MSSIERHDLVVHRDEALLVVVDVQRKLLPVIRAGEVMTRRLATLVAGVAALEVPIVVTEQYPEGLGATVDDVVTVLPKGTPVVAKSTFSCLRDEGFRDHLTASGRRQLVICGVETHICVLQTALDAVAAGFDVFVVSDACGTRLPHGGPAGLERMRQAGVRIAAVESVLFEMLERCDTDDFKRVLPLVRDFT